MNVLRNQHLRLIYEMGVLSQCYIYLPNEFFGLSKSFFSSFRSFLSIFIHTEHTYPKSYSFLVGLTTYLVIGPYICFLIVFCDFWKRESDLILSSINNRAPRHFMMQKNYIPIASWSVCVPSGNKFSHSSPLGWGCFNTSRRQSSLKEAMSYVTCHVLFRHVIAHCHVMSCHRPKRLTYMRHRRWYLP